MNSIPVELIRCKLCGAELITPLRCKCGWQRYVLATYSFPCISILNDGGNKWHHISDGYLVVDQSREII
jgi:hypothetical protein